MKTVSAILILVLLIAPFVSAAVIPPPCPQQGYLDLADLPFTADPNQIKGFAWSYWGVEEGGQYGSELRVCDPDGDPVAITTENLPANMVLDVNDWLQFSPSSAQAGAVYYIYVTATDSPPAGNAKTTTGTLVVYVYPRNEPPVILPFVVYEQSS